MNAATDIGASRSSFITSTAWTFIVFAGLASVLAVLQNIMVNFMLPDEALRHAVREAQQTQTLPAMAFFMFEHVRAVFAAFLALSVLTLVASVGLLQRKNWARQVFVGMMVLGVVLNLAGLLIPFFFGASLPSMPATAPAEFQNNFAVIGKMMWSVMAVLAIVFSLLLAWVAKRLVSAEIKREFNAL